MRSFHRTAAIAAAAALAASAMSGTASAVPAACSPCTSDGPIVTHPPIDFTPTFTNPIHIAVPVTPTDPVTPTEPFTPGEPVVPGDPVLPGDPIRPGPGHHHDGPSNVVGPTDPSRPPSDQITPGEPIRPDAGPPGGPAVVVIPGEPVKPADLPPPAANLPAGTSDGPSAVTGATGHGRDTFMVSLAGSRVTRTGRLRLRVTCPAPGPRCAATLGVRSRSRLAGRGQFSLAAGDTQVLGIALSRAARAALAPHPIVVPTGGQLMSYYGRWRAVLVQLLNHAQLFLHVVPTPIGTKVGRGQCTDWALDRRPDLAGVVTGDAWHWTQDARAHGLPVSKTPSKGAIVVFQPGVMGAGVPTGHVAYVESVNYDANGKPVSFVISEQNWNGHLESTTRTIQVSDLPPTGVDFIGL